MKTSAKSTRKYSLARTRRSGTLPLPSEQAAALLAIPTGGRVPETVAALTAMCLGLMGQTLSPDAFWLAVKNGERIALQAGVAPEEWERVGKIVLKHWKRERAKNPLSRMF